MFATEVDAVLELGGVAYAVEIMWFISAVLLLLCIECCGVCVPYTFAVDEDPMFSLLLLLLLFMTASLLDANRDGPSFVEHRATNSITL